MAVVLALLVAPVSALGSPAISSDGAVVPAATGGLSVVVSQRSGITNQAEVVTWSGYPAQNFKRSQGFYVFECKAHPKRFRLVLDPSNPFGDCYPLPTGLASSGPTALVVVAPGTPGNAIFWPGNGTGSGSASILIQDVTQNPYLGCSTTTTCSVVVIPSTDPGLAVARVQANWNARPYSPWIKILPGEASAPITFAPEPGSCGSAPTDIFASGAPEAGAAVTAWSENLCAGSTPVNVNYIDSGLGDFDGRENYLRGLAQIGVSATPMTATEPTAYPQAPKFVYAPIDIDPVVLVVHGFMKGQAITNLTLSPRLVAWLLAGDSSTSRLYGAPPSALFSDQEFLKLNSEYDWAPFQFNGSSTDCLDFETRFEQNADTQVVTDWVAHNAAAVNLLEGDDAKNGFTPAEKVSQYFHYLVAGVPTFPATTLTGNNGGYFPRQGLYQVTTDQLLGEVRTVLGYTSYGQGCFSVPIPWSQDGLLIGITDYATAVRNHLQMVKIVNAAGRAVLPTPQSIQAELADMTTNPDGTTQWPNFANQNPAAYPLTLVDYAILPTAGVTPAVGQAIKTFIDYAVTAGQTAAVLPVGYTPLTGSMIQTALAAAAKVPTSAPPKPPPSTTTTSTTKPPGSPSTTTTVTTVPTAAGAGGAAAGGNGSESTGGSATTAPTATGTTVGGTAGTQRTQKQSVPIAVAARTEYASAPLLAGSAVSWALPLLLAFAVVGGASGLVVARRGRRLGEPR